MDLANSKIFLAIANFLQLSDARATSRKFQGEMNLGHLYTMQLNASYLRNFSLSRGAFSQSVASRTQYII